MLACSRELVKNVLMEHLRQNEQACAPTMCHLKGWVLDDNDLKRQRRCMDLFGTREHFDLVPNLPDDI